MSANLVGTGKVAKMIDLPRHRLIWLLDTGRVPEPEFKVPGRRLFTTKDIERIRQAMAKLDERAEATA